jgi:hypothetical protein
MASVEDLADMLPHHEIPHFIDESRDLFSSQAPA